MFWCHTIPSNKEVIPMNRSCTLISVSLVVFLFIVSFIVLSIGIINAYHTDSAEAETEEQIEVIQPVQEPIPPHVDDLDVTVLHVLDNVTIVIDFEFQLNHDPKERFIRVTTEGGNIVITGRNEQRRVIQISKTKVLDIYNSMLYHEPGHNRLAVDMILE